MPFSFVAFIVYYGHDGFDELDSVNAVNRRLGNDVMIPGSSLNHRTSAHFIECNHIYTAEMLRRVIFLKYI